ncbi:MAG: DUF1285 domain-containing protein [Sphingobium sp.]|nr:DUF1285 domain-containing protein [Sphingobium sp.]
MNIPPLPDLTSLSLADIARLAQEQRLPPVDQWNPDHCGDSEMRIASDGRWYHQGGLINRMEMVRLFSTILRRESDGSYVLVTPVEKLSIMVEDAPFLAIELTSEGRGKDRHIAFRLSLGEIVVAGPDHPIILRGTAQKPRPYLHVRGPVGNGLEALLSRPTFYELAHLAMQEIQENDSPLGLWSDGAFFALEYQDGEQQG